MLKNYEIYTYIVMNYSFFVIKKTYLLKNITNTIQNINILDCNGLDFSLVETSLKENYMKEKLISLLNFTSKYCGIINY